jgi:type II secretory pathway component PulF
MAESEEGGSRGSAISLDQLIALNQEILALSRAGMPLERGLLEIASDLPGRLRSVTSAIGQRMEQGESLTDALRSSGAGVPKVYRAVVEAGVRSGRLSVALEGLATYARSFAEARRAIGMALWYPLTVLVLASGLFTAILLMVVPRFLSAFESLDLPPSLTLHVLETMRRYVWLWAPLPTVVVFIVFLAWSGTGSAASFGGRRIHGLLRFFPWLGRMMTGFEAAGYADLLALLVKHDVPYPEALVLAGDASADASLARSSRALADAVRSGQTPQEALKGPSAFPPLMRWLLTTGAAQGDFVSALTSMAERYRSDARRQSDKIRVFLPAILMLAIGATATVIYALTLFVPLTTLWTSLASQAS